MKKKSSLSKRDKLTPAEFDELEKQESIIKKHLRGFREAGAALLKIWHDKLWRGDYDSFGVYCEVKWGISSGWAKAQINASRFTLELPPSIADQIPSARAAVALARLDDVDRVKKIVTELAKEGPVTEKAVMDRIPKPKKPKASPEPPKVTQSMPAPDKCPLCHGKLGPDHAVWDSLPDAVKKTLIEGLKCRE